jgi:GNAT superfamily N-acetyltransferase
MAPNIRPARESDLVAADNLIVQAINDLTERHGFGRFASPSPPTFQAFSLHDDPQGLWISEDNDGLVGFAFAWVRDDLWVLAQLFVSPDYQGGGVGTELLARTLAHADANGCTRRALITFSFNRASQALYMRHGLFPTVPIYFFAAESARVQTRPVNDLRGVRLDEHVDLPKLAEIDRLAIGVTREKHHTYLLADEKTRGFGLFADGECAGYAYVSKTGHVGPVAVLDDKLLGDAFETALGLAAEVGAPQVSAFLPSTARPAIVCAVEHRMRITLPMVVMANDDFGHWTRYLPRDPDFM